MDPVVLIMAGGRGERFWPRSTVQNPKQLQKVYSDRTLLQETFERARNLTDPSRIFVGCNPALKQAILDSHSEFGPDQFVVEPQGRNTAPIVALAALQLERRFPGAVQIVLSADHYIAPPDEWQATMRRAVAVAEAGWLVTLGVRPSRPETGYGYIAVGQALDSVPDSGAFQIESFVEKPDLARARDYFHRDNFYWNSGIFIWSGPRIIEEFKAHAPAILEPLEQDEAFADDSRLATVFPTLPEEPVDIAIMEKSSSIAMIPASFTWDDVGSWLSLERIVEADPTGNVLVGQDGTKLVARGATGNIVVVGHKLVALQGVENLILVERDDVLYVANRDSVGEIKSLLAEMRKNPSLQNHL